MHVEALNAAIAMSVGLVLFIGMMSQVRTSAGRSVAFAVALVSIIAVTMLVFGTHQDFLGLLVLVTCVLLGSAVVMRLLHDQGVSPFVWGIGAFLGGVAGSFAGWYLGFVVACRGGDC
jgi:hypothetical protein